MRPVSFDAGLGSASLVLYSRSDAPGRSRGLPGTVRGGCEFDPDVRSRSAAWPAVLWCLFFAAVQVFWAIGGNLGLASSAGSELAARRPPAFVVFGLWGVAGLLGIGAVFAAIAGWQPLTIRQLRVCRALTVIIAVALLLRGAYVELALAANVGHLRRTVGPLEARWSLILWNPWFMIGGACFLILALLVQHRLKVAHDPA